MGFYRRTIVCTQKMSITEEKSFLSMRAKAPEANRGGRDLESYRGSSVPDIQGEKTDADTR